jgi:hypothetical protein
MKTQDYHNTVADADSRSRNSYWILTGIGIACLILSVFILFFGE